MVVTLMCLRLPASTRAFSHTPFIGRNDGASLKIVGTLIERLQADKSLLKSAHTDQAYDSAMRHVVQNCERTKVFVQCN